MRACADAHATRSYRAGGGKAAPASFPILICSRPRSTFLINAGHIKAYFTGQANGMDEFAVAWQHEEREHGRKDHTSLVCKNDWLANRKSGRGRRALQDAIARSDNRQHRELCPAAPAALPPERDL